jgi:uncharacterized membrane protein YedE/YeeE
MTEFTPWASLIGGAMIGLSAVLLMVYEGRIAGISGIASGLLSRDIDGVWKTRLSFVAGLVAAAVLVFLFTGAEVPQTVNANLPLMAVAGLLVGFGTVWGNGCTSGHGVCGMARLSTRSFVATGIFMVVAIVTVYVTRHVLGG